MSKDRTFNEGLGKTAYAILKVSQMNNLTSENQVIEFIDNNRVPRCFVHLKWTNYKTLMKAFILLKDKGRFP